jgi:hypothetical protein
MLIAPIPSRLGFIAAGRAAFNFVTQPPHATWLTEQDEGRIGYEGDDVVLVILHDLRSFELDIALWRPSVEDEVKHPFAISDMIRVADREKARSYRLSSAVTEDSVRRGVAKLASDFRIYGIATLTSGARFYREVTAARSEVAVHFGMELVDKAARKNAEEAWQQRDFQGVVNAYRTMEDRLSSVERGRLNYAIRRLGQ